ncbi:unnamed protein product, partial [Ectocarpus sp. 4 AP-2014]
GRAGSGSRRRVSDAGGKQPKEGFGLVGKTIKLHRDDVDYPNGRWCVADVQQWSRTQQKHLLSYRGVGSAWLPPGWLKLEEKRKAQVVSVAPAANPAAILNFAGHVPGVGSRSSTRCSPLDFLEAPTVVTPKSQTASGGNSSSSSSSRESAAAAAAEGLAVLAAAGEAATAAAEAAVGNGRRGGEEEGAASRRS